jgi:hypothetical protein
VEFGLRDSGETIADAKAFVLVGVMTPKKRVVHDGGKTTDSTVILLKNFSFNV